MKEVGLRRMIVRGMDIMGRSLTGPHGLFSRILSLDRVNDYITVNWNGNFTNKFSFVFWAKFISYNFMELFFNSCASFKWRMEGGKPYWNIFNSDGTYLSSVTYDTIPGVNEWHQYAFTYDGGIRSIYWNGVFIKQSGVITNVKNSNYLHIATEGERMGGLISDVRVFNRPLLASEISKIYNQTKSKYQ